ncbi:DUF805 domain-containing protein [Acinetobacter tianfuensis]|uniref:DUF805 domain-containing protein n=1 Tax=Acinetobacter tianfuensis TaxID=2419603 RepID=A0A3A8EJA4_9GAMM|nr:DUF805 domain-containing protein [Acinetobacter tianfuensis]RKG30810.1 DUF805 domain-containing protein [Acinetobacter tianfuensis]
MNQNENAPFFSHTPKPAADSLLSPNGRFGRLSFIGWHAFLNIMMFFTSIGLSLAAGIFSLNTLALDSHFINALTGIAGLGYAVLTVLYIYFYIVLTARRLHDRNNSGWLMLLLLIPVLNVLFILYLLLAAGDAGANKYGLPRPAAVWEKLLAWTMIILTALSLFAAGSLISFMMGSGQIKTPQEVMQKGTEFF